MDPICDLFQGDIDPICKLGDPLFEPVNRSEKACELVFPLLSSFLGIFEPFFDEIKGRVSYFYVA